MKRITLIIPCYNEQAVLPLFYREATETLSALPVDYELLFINDGSTDGTLDTLRVLAEESPHVSYLSLSRNFGKEAAMYAGFCNAKGDYIGVMDVDLQDPPALLAQMFERLEAGDCDCVATRRVTRQGEPPIRSFFARTFYRLMRRISRTEVADGARDFRLMRREMAEAIVALGENNRFSKGIFGWVGFRTEWIAYENVRRAAGETKWSFRKLAAYALDGIINFSDAPLNLASWAGLAMTAVSVLALLFIVLRRLIFGDPVAGWASTVCIIVFIGGLQTFCIGIIGRYLAKTYVETKKRPHFIVAESNRDNVTKIG